MVYQGLFNSAKLRPCIGTLRGLYPYDGLLIASDTELCVCNSQGKVAFKMQFIRSFTLACTCCTAMALYGQGGKASFGEMSAKERSRIAEAEEEGASMDGKFQALMAHAEGLFREQRFEEALERFTEARDLRPYNVYPRVKIQDLQALIARREQEAEPPLAPTLSFPEPIAQPAEHAPQEVQRIVLAQPTTLEPPSPRAPAPEPVQPPKAVHRPEPTVKKGTLRLEETATPQEEGERIYKEGRAVVVERSAMVEGKLVNFRKVLHPWGEVMYFRDGASIPERAWVEAFGAQ